MLIRTALRPVWCQLLPSVVVLLKLWWLLFGLIFKLLLQECLLLLLLDSELLSLLLLQLDNALADLVTIVRVELIVQHALQDNRSNVIDLRVCEQLEGWGKIHKLTVVGVVVPTQDGDAVLRLELVAVRRIVDDYGLLELTAHTLHVLDVHAIVVAALLSEEPLRSDVLRIELVHEGIRVFRQ